MNGFIFHFVTSFFIGISTFAATFTLIRLADVMFGDDSDDDAKGAKKEYTFKPKARGGRRKNSGDEDEED